MKSWTKALVALLLAGVLLPTVSMARSQGDDYEWKTWRTRRSHAGFNGFGGFFYGGQIYQSNALKSLADGMGVTGLDETLRGFGGWGMAHIRNGWRIGGLGYGYIAKGTGVYTDPGTGQRYNRRVEMDLGAGGFIVEYSPWMIGPVNFGLGSVLGWGGVTLSLHQDSGVFRWDDLAGQYIGNPNVGENMSTQITQSFVLAEPYVTARVHLLDWMAFSATVGYHFDSLRAANWQFETNDLSGNGPDMNLNQVFVRAGLVFGG